MKEMIKKIASIIFSIMNTHSICSAAQSCGHYEGCDIEEIGDDIKITIKYNFGPKGTPVYVCSDVYHSSGETCEEIYRLKSDGTLLDKNGEVPYFITEEWEEVKREYADDLDKLNNMLKSYAENICKNKKYPIITDEFKAYIMQDMELFGAEYAIKKLYNIDPDILTYRTYMDYIEDGASKEAGYREIYQSIIKYIAKDVSLIEHTIDAVTSNGDTIEGAAEYNGLEFFFHSYQHDGMESHEESAASCYVGTIIENIKRQKEEKKYA